jgi:hypothetical protein
MRRLALVVMLVLLLPVTAAAQDFYRLYEQGVSAYNDGRLDEAKEKMEAAKAKSPRQGPRVFFYGVRYEEYAPDYYLGMIAFQQQRYGEALRLLEGVEKGKFLRSGERSERLAQTLGSVRQQIARASKPDPPPTPPPTPQWQVDFQRALASGEQALREKRFDGVRSAVNTARPLARDARTQGELAGLERRLRADEGAAIADSARSAITGGNETAAQAHLDRLAAYNAQHPGLEQLRADLRDLQRRREADAVAGRARQALRGANPGAAAQEIARLAGINPRHAALPGLRADLGRLEASLKATPAPTPTPTPTPTPPPPPVSEPDRETLRRAERDAMRLFFRGDYAGARSHLEAFGQAPTPRMQLYLASSQAALALLRKDAALADQARRTYGEVKQHAATFEADFRYISPAVVQLLNGGAL